MNILQGIEYQSTARFQMLDGNNWKLEKSFTTMIFYRNITEEYQKETN